MEDMGTYIIIIIIIITLSIFLYFCLLCFTYSHTT